MTDFEFVNEVPDRHVGKTPDPLLVEFADALRANPGKWAKYPKQLTGSSVYTYANGINNPIGGNGNRPPVMFRDGEFEARASSRTLYVRAKA